MTLDETIKEAKDASVIYENEARKCAQHDDSLHKEKARAFGESAKDFEQIAKWLEELKAYRTTNRPQGEWIITEQDNGHKWTHRKCSECGKGIIEPLGVSGMNYCPNCGADMRKIEGNSFISVPKEQLEFKPLSPEEIKEMIGENNDS